MISIDITTSTGESRRFSFDITDGAEIRIGRDEQCDVALPGETYLSRVHCIISYTNGQIVIQDNQSSNGVYLNGERIISDFLVMNEPYKLGDCTMLATEDTSTQATNDSYGNYPQPAPTQGYPTAYPQAEAYPQPQAYPQAEAYPQPAEYPAATSAEAEAYPQPVEYQAEAEAYPQPQQEEYTAAAYAEAELPPTEAAPLPSEQAEEPQTLHFFAMQTKPAPAAEEAEPKVPSPEPAPVESPEPTPAAEPAETPQLPAEQEPEAAATPTAPTADNTPEPPAADADKEAEEPAPKKLTPPRPHIKVQKRRATGKGGKKGSAPKAPEPEVQVVSTPGNLMGIPYEFDLVARVTAPGKRLEEGAALRFYITTARDCRVYLIAHDSEGNVELLLPTADAPDNLVFTTVEGKFPNPGSQQQYAFNVEPPFGREVITVLAFGSTAKCEFAREIQDALKQGGKVGEFESALIERFRTKHAKLQRKKWSSCLLHLYTWPKEEARTPAEQA